MGNEIQKIEQKEITTTNDVSTIMALIERVVENPNVDIEKMKQLMEMHEQVLDRNNKQFFAQDFALMKPHLPKVIKSKRNDHTKSNYAALEDINQAIDTVLGKYGFATSTSITAQTENSVTVTAKLWHSEGHSEETSVTMPLDNKGSGGTINKTAVHATASTITYAKRVAICALLNISTGDADGNTENNKPVSKVQAGIISEKIMQCSQKTKDWFKEEFKSAQEVPINKFDWLINNLNNAIEKVKEANDVA